MKIGVITCGNSNVTSMVNALEYIGLNTSLLAKPDDGYDFLIMPGVGSFDSGITSLKQSGFFDTVQMHINSGKPFLGICLGMQMLFDSSDEGNESGLSILPGRITKLGTEPTEHIRKPPNIGYNYVAFSSNNSLLDDKLSGFYYFLHSYALKDKPKQSCMIGTSMFNSEIFFPFFIRQNICGIQFHPERSGHRGLSLLSYVIEQLSAQLVNS